MKYIIVFGLLFFSFLNSFSNSHSRVPPLTFKQNDRKDSIPNKRAFGALKISPVQPVFSEIPLSFEVYMSRQKSLQIQVGYIYTGPEYVKLSDWGEDGTDINEGILSYRTNPYNNDEGINIKIEFRKYKNPLVSYRNVKCKSFYYAPQIMYKYCFYNDQTHCIKYNHQFCYYLTESKDANIFGFGIMIGNQSFRRKSVIDFYGGLGLRVRLNTITISKRYEYWGPFRTTYPNSKDIYTSFYPFVNLGLRFGFEL